MASIAVGTHASAQNVAYEQFLEDLKLLPSELQLDSIYDYSLLYRPFGPLFDESKMLLTENDYREVAESLGVEVAAIKAVVEIETGNKCKGFWKPGQAIINFDLSIYSQYAPRHDVKVSDTRRRKPEIFAPLNIKKHGSRQAAMYARLEAAKEIDEELALESCFWGMFQIGGFNWQKCGTESVRQFVDLINTSEREQLNLFAEYCRSRDLVKYIQARDWAGFSLRYNGPGYYKLGYDKKMATAYARHLKDDK